MDDIRIPVSFKGHRKRKKLTKILGAGATDHLIDLWLSARMSRSDGILTGWDAEDIALEAGWEGDAQAFTDALIAVGFLEQCEGISDRSATTLCLHDWDEHQGWACGEKRRSEAARTAARARWGPKDTPQKNLDNATALRPVMRPESPLPSPSPYPYPRNTPPVSKTDDETILSIPLASLDKSPQNFDVKFGDAKDWQSTFSLIDVVSELKKIRQWSVDNPGKRKTKNGIRRHINSWLTRASDQAKPQTDNQQANHVPDTEWKKTYNGFLSETFEEA